MASFRVQRLAVSCKFATSYTEIIWRNIQKYKYMNVSCLAKKKDGKEANEWQQYNLIFRHFSH